MRGHVAWLVVMAACVAGMASSSAADEAHYLGFEELPYPDAVFVDTYLDQGVMFHTNTDTVAAWRTPDDPIVPIEGVQTLFVAPGWDNGTQFLDMRFFVPGTANPAPASGVSFWVGQLWHTYDVSVLDAGGNLVSTQTVSGTTDDDWRQYTYADPIYGVRIQPSDYDGFTIDDFSYTLLDAPSGPIQWRTEDGGNAHFYEFVPTTGVTWTQANAASQLRAFGSVQGHLATVTSQGENDFLAAQFGHVVGDVGWLGGYQDPGQAPDAGWHWVTGESFDYANWSPTEPNDHTGDERYLQMLGPADMNPWKWNDDEDDSQPPYIDGYFLEYPLPDGDFDSDGDVDADDIDLLCDNIGDAAYDLDGDSDADEDDLIFMVEQLVEWSGGGESGVGTKRGDFNLDGLVNATDLAIMKTNYGTWPRQWVHGNANCDDIVDATDLAILKTNYGFVAPTGAVPEPVSLSLLGGAALLLLRRRRRDWG